MDGGAQCVLLETGAPAKGSGRQMVMMGETGKPGANKPPHASYNNPPNFLQLWPLIPNTLPSVDWSPGKTCDPWEKKYFDHQSKEVLEEGWEIEIHVPPI